MYAACQEPIHSGYNELLTELACKGLFKLSESGDTSDTYSTLNKGILGTRFNINPIEEFERIDFFPKIPFCYQLYQLGVSDPVDVQCDKISDQFFNLFP